MHRPTASSTQRTSLGSALLWTLGDVWSNVIRPALAIAAVGAAAVLYLVTCARLSVIECDLQRLERVAEQEQMRELQLRRRLADLRNAGHVREHIAMRGLTRPADFTHVRLGEVPASLSAALPDAAHEEPATRLGQLPPDIAAAQLTPASAQ